MMSNPILPVDWEKSSLDSLAEYINGYAFKPSDWHGQGLPIVRIAQITGSSNAQDFYNGILPECYLLKPNDLIFSWSGTLEVVIWKHGEAWLNQHLFKVVPRKGINQKFLFHLLKWHVWEMSKRAHGSTMKHIKRKELKEFETYLPSSEDEQKTIVAILDTLDEAIAAAEDLLAKQEKMKQGLLQDLFTRGVDENGQLRPHWDEQPDLYHKTEFGEICGNWGMFKSLYDIADIHYGKSPNIVKADSGTFPIIGTSGIIGLAVEPLFKRPAIVVGRKGTLDNPILTSEPFWAIDTTYAVIPKNGTNLRWLFYCLVFANLKRLNEATGVPSLSRDSLGNLSIFCPKYDEQKYIVAILDSIDEIKAETNSELKKLFKIKIGLMQDLLTGHCRVTPELIQQVEILTLTRSAD